MASCLASVLYKISSEALDTVAIMNSKSSTVIIVYSFVLLSLDFFRDVGFIGENFLFLDVSISSRGFQGGVTLPFF
jgi:hypothetical protein